MEKKRILLVEDEESWINILKNYITSADKLSSRAQVHVVGSCKEGLRELVDHKYHLVIIDIGLGQQGDGMCLVRVSSRLQNATPAIIVSGKISKPDLLHSSKKYNVKAKDIFLKSEFNAEEFVGRVENVILVTGEKVQDPNRPGSGEPASAEASAQGILKKMIQGLRSQALLFISIYVLLLILVEKTRPTLVSELRYLWYVLPVLAIGAYLIERRFK